MVGARSEAGVRTAAVTTAAKKTETLPKVKNGELRENKDVCGVTRDIAPH